MPELNHLKAFTETPEELLRWLASPSGQNLKQNLDDAVELMRNTTLKLHIPEELFKPKAEYVERIQKLVLVSNLAEGARREAAAPSVPAVSLDVPDVPPAGASFLLACVASKGRAEEYLGDAETEYRRLIPQLGAVGARWWYRVYVVKIASRMLPSVLMRLLLVHKLFGLLGL
jgi:hypothetical protein